MITHRKASAYANIIMWLLPFIISWSLIILTAGEITPSVMYTSLLFWLPAVAWFGLLTWYYTR